MQANAGIIIIYLLYRNHELNQTGGTKPEIKDAIDSHP